MQARLSLICCHKAAFAKLLQMAEERVHCLQEHLLVPAVWCHKHSRPNVYQALSSPETQPSFARIQPASSSAHPPPDPTQSPSTADTTPSPPLSVPAQSTRNQTLLSHQLTINKSLNPPLSAPAYPWPPTTILPSATPHCQQLTHFCTCSSPTLNPGPQGKACLTPYQASTVADVVTA